MIERCCRPTNVAYHNYGGRGIQICDRWLRGEGEKSGFECFFADMGPKPSPELSLERDDVNGIYEPTNCYWAPPEVQAGNKRGSTRIEMDDGRILCLTQVAHEIGWYRTKLFRRIDFTKRMLEVAAGRVGRQLPTDPCCETPWFLTWRSFRNAGSLLTADTTKLEPRLTREERREYFKAIWAARDARPVQRRPAPSITPTEVAPTANAA